MNSHRLRDGYPHCSHHGRLKLNLYRGLRYVALTLIPGFVISGGWLTAQEIPDTETDVAGAPVAEATLATLPSGEGSPEADDLIARMIEIPYAGTASGRGTTLAEALAYARNRADTVRIVRLYWRASESVCRFRAMAEHAERLRRLQPLLQPLSGDQPILEYLRSDVERRLGLLATTLRRDQEDLAEGMRLLRGTGRNRRGDSDVTDSDVRIPLPSDLPLTGGYETLFDQFYRSSRGTLDPGARLLDCTLPLRQKVVESRASQVAAAEFVLQDTIDACTRGQSTVQVLLRSVNESLRSREEFITAVYQYNHDIADYIFMVSPELVGTSIVPRLIHPQSPESVNELGLNLRANPLVRIPPQLPSEKNVTDGRDVGNPPIATDESDTATSHTVARPQTRSARVPSQIPDTDPTATSIAEPVSQETLAIPSGSPSESSGNAEMDDGVERIPRLNLPGAKPYRPERPSVPMIREMEESQKSGETSATELLTASWRRTPSVILVAMQTEEPTSLPENSGEPTPPMPDPTVPPE
ncbi:MAG: hypothetical protein Q4C47_06415, partial [Planctomycetia bacterium]|nr:hypothetical protein [Planctomycetia bacterium]